MSIFSHNIYENVRTRVIVTYDGKLLLLEPLDSESGWRLPGGGLEYNESLMECGEREVFEETAIKIKATSVAFLREWVVPKYCIVPDSQNSIGYGLEVYLYAHPVTDQLQPRAENPDAQKPHWIPLALVPALPLWPKELKTLAPYL